MAQCLWRCDVSCNIEGKFFWMVGFEEQTSYQRKLEEDKMGGSDLSCVLCQQKDETE